MPRFNLLVKYMTGEMPELETQVEKHSPEMDWLKSDQQTVMALTDSHLECEYEMAMNQDDPLPFDPSQNPPNALEPVYYTIDRRLMPLIIVRDITKPPVYATLSRNPGWTGMPPALPMLNGLQALIMTYRHHGPTLILAILDNSPDVILPTRPEHPQRNKQNVRGMDSLVKVLEYHGAAPRFMYKKRPTALRHETSDQLEN